LIRSCQRLNFENAGSACGSSDNGVAKALLTVFAQPVGVGSLQTTSTTARFAAFSALPGLGGLSIAAAILMKLFAAEARLPGIWLVTAYRTEIRGRRVQALYTYLIGAAGPVCADFAFLHPSQQWDQVITLHERAAQAHLPDLTPPAKILDQFLTLDLGLTLLAAAGILALVSIRRWKDAGFLASWVLGSLLMLYLFRPLFPHHAVILLTGLAVSAGTGAGLEAGQHGDGRQRDAAIGRIRGFPGGVERQDLRFRCYAGSMRRPWIVLVMAWAWPCRVTCP